MSRSRKRLHKELEKIKAENLSDFSVNVVDESKWDVVFEMPNSSVYAGETFTLEFIFCENYPIESPQVKFIPPSPEHSHVYSNGHICLNILYEEWTPALTVKSIVMSLISMLHSATDKERPPDNIQYSAAYPPASNPKKTRFIFDDDKV